MRKIEAAMNRAIVDGQNWHSANTRVEYENDSRISKVYLHGNLIAEVGETFVKLSDGGWRTSTTKSRLNAILRECGDNDSIYQKNHTWFIRTKQGVEPFYNGICLM